MARESSADCGFGDFPDHGSWPAAQRLLASSVNPRVVDASTDMCD